MDTSLVYSLTNAYSGPDQELAVAGDGTTIEMLLLPSSDTFVPSTSAAWTLSEAGVDAAPGVPFYRLHTVAGGAGQSLDVLNNNGVDSVNVQMTATADVSGQLWRLDLWPVGDANGAGYRLSNNFTGLDKHLDVYSDTLQPHLAGETDRTGQHWTFQAAPAGWAASTAGASPTATRTTITGGFSPNPTTTSTTTEGPSSTTTTATTSNSGVSDSDSGGSLSKGAVAGIAVGSGVATLAVLAAVGFALLRYLRRSEAGTGSGNNNGIGDGAEKDKEGPVSPAPPAHVTYELGADEPAESRGELPG